jgi:hypothetical protein
LMINKMKGRVEGGWKEHHEYQEIEEKEDHAHDEYKEDLELKIRRIIKIVMTKRLIKYNED